MLIALNVIRRNYIIWKLESPLKIKIFVCLIKGIVLTKDNLAKRQ